MNNNQENWEYCKIEAQIQDDGRDAGYGGQKLMWLQFRARSDELNRIIDHSEKIPLASMAGSGSYAPQKSDLGHQNTLSIFLEKLQSNGWELLPADSGEWWQRRLRRIEVPTTSLIDKIKNLV